MFCFTYTVEGSGLTRKDSHPKIPVNTYNGKLTHKYQEKY